MQQDVNYQPRRHPGYLCLLNFNKNSGKTSLSSFALWDVFLSAAKSRRVDGGRRKGRSTCCQHRTGSPFAGTFVVIPSLQRAKMLARLTYPQINQVSKKCFFLPYVQVTVGTPEGDPTRKEPDRNGESQPITERKRKSRSRSSSFSSSDSDADYKRRRKRKRSPRRYSSDSESSNSEYERNKRRHHRDDYHRRRGSRERDDRGRHRSRSRERDRDRDRVRDRDKDRYRETDRHRHSRSDRSRHEDRDRHKDSQRHRNNNTGRNSAGKGSGWDNAPSNLPEPPLANFSLHLPSLGQAQMQINAAVAHLQQVAQGPIVAKPPPTVIQKRKLLWGKKSEVWSRTTAKHCNQTNSFFFSLQGTIRSDSVVDGITF